MEGGSAGCMETRPRWRGSGPKTRQTVAERRKFGLEVSMMGTCEGYTCPVLSIARLTQGCQQSGCRAGKERRKAGDRGHGACENALAGIKDGAPSGPLSGEHGDGTRPGGQFEKLGARTSNLRTSRPRKASKAMLSGLGTGVRVRSRGKRIYRWRREKSACPRASYGSEKNSPM